MKNPDRNTIAQLESLPNIGKAIAANLRLIGINHPRQLIGQDPFSLYENLCELTQKHYDPCVLDVFMSAVDFMEGSEAAPWWSYSKERKKMLSIKNSVIGE